MKGRQGFFSGAADCDQGLCIRLRKYKLVVATIFLFFNGAVARDVDAEGHSVSWSHIGLNYSSILIFLRRSATGSQYHC